MIDSRVFWSHFEEPTSEASEIAAIAPTKTVTATREEDDQDQPLDGYRAVPRIDDDMRTKTITETREESDQDRSCCGFTTPLVTSSGLGTTTFTKTREEADQDEPCAQYKSFA